MICVQWQLLERTKWKRGRSFQPYFPLRGEKKRKKTFSIIITVELKIDVYCTFNDKFLWERRLNMRNWSQLRVKSHFQVSFSPHWIFLFNQSEKQFCYRLAWSHVMSVTRSDKTRKWEISNRPEPNLDKFNSSDIHFPT